MYFWLIFSLAGQAPQDLREAARLDQAGRCKEAEPIYERALARGTPGPALLNNTGNHYLICGQPEKASGYFERLLRVDQAHSNAMLQLGRIELNAGRFGRAVELLSKLAVVRPGDFDVLYLLGRAAGRAGHGGRAKEALEAALRLRPDDPAAMLECGLANAAAGDYPRAVFLLARAHSRAPDQPGIALALARASEDAGYYGDAVAAYDRYLTLSPKDESARRDRARSLARTISGSDQGSRELAEYVARNPRDPLGHFYLAQIRWSRNAEEALASLSAALRLDPKLAPAHVARAWLLHRLGRDSEALPHLAAALRIVPRDIRALDQMGLVLIALDRSAEAETHLRKAASLAPGDADVALHLGRVLMERDQEAEGRKWLDLYQQLRPARQRDARREAGMIELATLDPAGRRAREIERFRSMAKARPDDPILQLHLSELLLSDGRREEALAAYRTLLTLAADGPVWTKAGKTLLDAGEHDTSRPFLERAGASVELAEALLRGGDAEAALRVLDGVAPDNRISSALLLRARILHAAGKHGESAQALDQAVAKAKLLQSAIEHAPSDRELLLTEAVLYGLQGDADASMERLRKLEARWPEWDQPRLVHGILLRDVGRATEAASVFRAAAASGARDGGASCANLREWAFGSCRK